ncbi:hypothetical protein ANTHELSMS3_01534 [Antarctobacter heliothermus]|uniref:Uncharacterized protein n=1 Tax=Antarctobacter heliothermus TaxID=74033 RepID=A0A222E236_9RHOB|nr:hypothetical protein [Antarctobacter heliothermus]ASP20230.1 hypothetical protein ANTHELSMS3_01534 [Antarctobacter heliothermus]
MHGAFLRQVGTVFGARRGGLAGLTGGDPILAALLWLIPVLMPARRRGARR